MAEKSTPRIDLVDLVNAEILNSVRGKDRSDVEAAYEFRRLFNRDEVLGNMVLHTLLFWCAEYTPPPKDNTELQRWAGRRDVAALIKAALYADLSKT
jgi:hypothetical protein